MKKISFSYDCIHAAECYRRTLADRVIWFHHNYIITDSIGNFMLTAHLTILPRKFACSFHDHDFSLFITYWCLFLSSSFQNNDFTSYFTKTTKAVQWDSFHHQIYKSTCSCNHIFLIFTKQWWQESNSLSQSPNLPYVWLILFFLVFVKAHLCYFPSVHHIIILALLHTAYFFFLFFSYLFLVKLSVLLVFKL